MPPVLVVLLARLAAADVADAGGWQRGQCACHLDVAASEAVAERAEAAARLLQNGSHTCRAAAPGTSRRSERQGCGSLGWRPG